MKKVVITSGDLDGIGLEVSTKAIEILGPQRKQGFLLFCGAKDGSKELIRLRNKFDVLPVDSLSAALKVENWPEQLILIKSKDHPAKWIEQSARAAMKNEISALVTGPLSKPEILRSGLKDIGHTQILKRITRSRNLKMAFIGDQFSVSLLTDHVALSRVKSQLKAEQIVEDIHRSHDFFGATARRPLGILGLNPHAGDHGLIGDFEVTLLSAIIQKLQKKGLFLRGPLVPDAAFLPENWKKYCAYLCCYHDQGLIPFKMIHGFDSGVHVTLGLPFLRTSVDHGTAKDIFGKNRANPNSMVRAIQFALDAI